MSICQTLSLKLIEKIFNFNFTLFDPQFDIDVQILRLNNYVHMAHIALYKTSLP